MTAIAEETKILPPLGSWAIRAACKGAPSQIFVSSGDEDDEETTPSPEASAFCQLCAVRVKCLDWALEHEPDGIWGDTTKYQRRQILSNRSRVKCPSCRAPKPISHGVEQVCLACGMSWTAT